MKFFLTFLVVLYSSSYLEGVRFRCDYKYFNIGWFKYHAIPATWRDARLQCQLEDKCNITSSLGNIVHSCTITQFLIERCVLDMVVDSKLRYHFHIDMIVGGVLAFPVSTDIRKVLKYYACNLENGIFTGIHATFSKLQYASIEGVPLAEIPHEWVGGEPDNKNNAESCLAINSNGKFSDVSCGVTRQYVCYRQNSSVDVNVCGTPDPEYRFKSRTNKCYKFHTEARTFERAFFACFAEGGHLAIINSNEESNVIRDIFAKNPGGSMVGNFWKYLAFIGVTWNEGTDWRTIHGESLEQAGFAKFSGGEPNNSTTGENCGSVYRNGLLNDLWCEKHYAFICEKKPDQPPVCDINNKNNHFKYTSIL